MSYSHGELELAAERLMAAARRGETAPILTPPSLVTEPGAAGHIGDHNALSTGLGKVQREQKRLSDLEEKLARRVWLLERFALLMGGLIVLLTVLVIILALRG